MLATLVIGLREGLEATLIVGIIAAFLRRNGVSLRPMWLGVGLAVLLSIGVGVTLQLVAQALPQAQQEAMEAIIGAVAVVIVTGMIAWMRVHARDLRSELESSARVAVGTGTAWALAGMAFLAVLKEGFETSVFLLATFQAASSVGLAALGAVVGIAAAVFVGFGIYTGGVRLDLGRFFTGTGVFLVVVAAGLTLTVVRRAHEAGWLTIGQQRTVDLSWLVPNGTVRSALITGVLGVPADPRLIEVVAWLAYLVPVLTIALWPRRRFPAAHRVPLVRGVVAAVLGVAALALAVGVPGGTASVPTSATVLRGTGAGAGARAGADPSAATGAAAPAGPARGTATVATTAGTSTAARATLRVSVGDRAVVTFPASAHQTTTRAGVTADRWRRTDHVASTGRPGDVTLDDLTAMLGRVPVGVSPGEDPGPFRARWTTTATTTLWTTAGGLLDARRDDRAVVTISGGGLPTSRTYSVVTRAWHVPAATVSARAADVAAATTASREGLLWRVLLPIALAVGAIVQVVLALRDRRRLRGAGRPALAAPAADAAADAAARPTTTTTTTTTTTDAARPATTTTTTTTAGASAPDDPARSPSYAAR